MKRWLQVLGAKGLVELQRKLGIYAIHDRTIKLQDDILVANRRIYTLETSPVVNELRETIDRLKPSTLPVVLFKARCILPGYFLGESGDEQKPRVSFDTAWVERLQAQTGTIQTQPTVEGTLTSVELLNSTNDLVDIMCCNMHLLVDGRWPSNKEFPVPAELGKFTPANRISVVIGNVLKE